MQALQNKAQLTIKRSLIFILLQVLLRFFFLILDLLRNINTDLLRLNSHVYIFLSEKPITVGWGKKETQFHGSQGKPTAADVQEVVSVIFFSTWCNILVVIFIPVCFKSHRENYIQCFYFEVLLASTEGYFK